MHQNYTKSIKPQPSPLKRKLQDLQITAGAAARYVDRSYPYFCNQLNGVAPMTPEVEQKLQELINRVEGIQ